MTNRQKLSELQEALRTPRGYVRYVKERDPKAVIQWLLEAVVSAEMAYILFTDWLDEEA